MRKVTRRDYTGIRVNGIDDVLVRYANCRASDDGRACNVFTFQVTDLSQLKNIMKALTKVSGVVAVERV